LIESKLDKKHTRPFILWFSELGRNDLEIAGGKGANLGELFQGGFPVPTGFVVTTAAYDCFVENNRLGQVISRALWEERDSGTTIRSAFEVASVPPEIEREIFTAYEKLGQNSVAVRSSATAEDLAGAAFAGQQDTFLNIIGTEALLTAVRRCFASLWTDRAIAYRKRQNIDQYTVKIAVVVQHMVAAEVAGVMFTANPVTGAQDEIVIDSNPGLGEAIVSGLVTPDHFVLRKRWLGWNIAERRRGRHEVIIKPRSGGSTERIEGTRAIEVAVLPDKALFRLARLGAAIEHHFGFPQDIEWAWANKTAFIVQARPITALPQPLPRPSSLQSMLASLFAEMFAIRPYPLDITAWVPEMSSAVTSIFTLIGIEAPPFDQMFTEEDGVVISLKDKFAFRLTLGILLAPVRLFLFILRYNPIRWQDDPLLTDAQSHTHDMKTRNLSTLSWKDLLATVREAIVIFTDVGELRRRYYPRALLAAGLLRLSLELLGQGNRFAVLLSGTENKTLEVNRALEALAERIRSDHILANTFARHEAGDLWKVLEAQSEGQAFLIELKDFLDSYGHRESVISTALQPTWKDAPEVVLGILKGLALTKSQPQTGQSAWKNARDETLKHPVFRLRSIRSMFLNLLMQARSFMQIREDTHFYATLSLPVIRRTFLEFGRRLVNIGLVKSSEDIFHLKLSELEQIGESWPPSPQLVSDLRATIQRRKNRRAAIETIPLVNPRFFRRAEPEGDVLLSGTSGSPGDVKGPVRIILNDSEFDKLRSGEVLVAPYTNPAWTPLFQRAIAAVVDTGGTGSHAAIVAREYGIPAVMGTIDGTRKLKNGQRVRVDGNRGLVLRVEHETHSKV
jgi:phosphohistidine swiveling domain-containing protein